MLRYMLRRVAIRAIQVARDRDLVRDPLSRRTFDGRGCKDELAHLMSNGAWSRYCTAALPERQATGSGASRLRAASVESKLRLASRGARLGPCNHSRTRPGSLKPLPMGPRVPAAIDAL